MLSQTLKFNFNNTEMKVFFRYPDRKKSALTAEQKEEIVALNHKKSIVEEALKALSEVGRGEFKVIFKRQEPIEKGSGPVSCEFHIVTKTGEDENGKGIYKDVYAPSLVKFHTSSERNSYEKARQYAIHKFIKDNGIIKDTDFYNEIVNSYESRGEGVAKFCRDINRIERLHTEKPVKKKRDAEKVAA